MARNSIRWLGASSGSRRNCLTLVALAQRADSRGIFARADLSETLSLMAVMICGSAEPAKTLASGGAYHVAT